MRFPFSQEDLKKILGLYMRGLRIRKQATLASIAKTFGHKNSTFILAIEQGRQPIPMDKILKYTSAYGADDVYFPRLVLLVWYPPIWELFKDNLHGDDHIEHSMEKRRWVELYADEEIMGLLIHGLFDMMHLYKFKYQNELRKLISRVHGWRIRTPSLPPHMEPEFVKQCEDEIRQKKLDEDALRAHNARVRQEREERRARGELPPLKNRTKENRDTTKKNTKKKK